MLLDTWGTGDLYYICHYSGKSKTTAILKWRLGTPCFDQFDIFWAPWKVAFGHLMEPIGPPGLIAFSKPINFKFVYLMLCENQIWFGWDISNSQNYLLVWMMNEVFTSLINNMFGRSSRFKKSFGLGFFVSFCVMQ